MNNYHTRHKLNLLLDNSSFIQSQHIKSVRDNIDFLYDNSSMSRKVYLDAIAVISDPNLNNKTLHRLNTHLNSFDKVSGRACI